MPTCRVPRKGRGGFGSSVSSMAAPGARAIPSEPDMAVVQIRSPPPAATQFAGRARRARILVILSLSVAALNGLTI
jgi:hypothetical protein